MKKEMPPFGVLAADYDEDRCIIVRSGTSYGRNNAQDAIKPKTVELMSRNHTPEARHNLESGSHTLLSTKRVSKGHDNSDARASLDRGKKTLSERTEVKLFDQKSIALHKSTTTTTQGTLAEQSNTAREESNH